MHSPEERSSRDPVDAAADRVLDAFVDSFYDAGDGNLTNDRWLMRLIEALEEARHELVVSLAEMKDTTYKRNLARCTKRVESVLAQLYEEQLLH